MKIRTAIFFTIPIALTMLFSTSMAQGIQGKSEKPTSRPNAEVASKIAVGRKIYMSNCASCHGTNGAGSGIVAGSLKKQPKDLTNIPLKDGNFPTQELVMSISGELSVPIHGDRSMPVWGGVLKNGEVLALVKYIESIQKPLK